MTHRLSKRLLNELVKPKRKRRFNDTVNLLPTFAEAQYFDVTDLMDLAVMLCQNMNTTGILPFNALLPAETTFLEWRHHQDGALCGALLASRDGSLTRGAIAVMDKWQPSEALAFNFDGPSWGFSRDGRRPSNEDEKACAKFPEALAFERADFDAHVRSPQWDDRVDVDDANFPFDGDAVAIDIVPAFLALINTPKITRKIVRSARIGTSTKTTSGKYPLRAFTEVKIYLRQQQPINPTVIGPLTGRRALHHVRTFVRVRLGRIEVVRPHWRGDPSLGMVMKRRTMLVEPQPHMEGAP